MNLISNIVESKLFKSIADKLSELIISKDKYPIKVIINPKWIEENDDSGIVKSGLLTVDELLGSSYIYGVPIDISENVETFEIVTTTPYEVITTTPNGINNKIKLSSESEESTMKFQKEKHIMVGNDCRGIVGEKVANNIRIGDIVVARYGSNPNSIISGLLCKDENDRIYIMGYHRTCINNDMKLLSLVLPHHMLTEKLLNHFARGVVIKEVVKKPCSVIDIIKSKDVMSEYFKLNDMEGAYVYKLFKKFNDYVLKRKKPNVVFWDEVVMSENILNDTFYKTNR